jgi:hypothetical protein
MRRISCLALAALACGAGFGQVSVYGSPTPVPYAGTFDSGGQIPYAGNSNFKLALHDPNNFGGGLLLGFAPTSLPLGAATLLVDPNGAVLITLPPGATQFPLAVPNVPAIVGYTGFAQAGVLDGALPGGFGLTNGISVTVLPNRTPTRA